MCCEVPASYRFGRMGRFAPCWAIEPTMSAACKINASRAPVAFHPITSLTFLRRYRTVLGCTKSSRAVASRERPLSR